MKKTLLISAALAMGVAALAVAPASAHMAEMKPGVVKITPLGSHTGEFCRRDRAMLFEDPDGTRVLYDVGFTVAGPKDPRLGKIDATR